MTTAAFGVVATGTLDMTPDDNGIPAGSSLVMLILAIALLVGFLAYAAVEWTQTRRLDSISRQFDTRTIVLIPIAIAINIVLGQTVGAALRLPVYLDSIGTILVGVLAGPIAGMLTGLLSNVTWAFLLAGTPFAGPYAWPFAIVAAEIGLLAGLFGYAGVFRPRPNTPPARLAAGIVAGFAVLLALAWYGILPFYRNLCATAGAGGTPQSGLCFDLFAGGRVDPLFAILGVVVLAVVVVALIALVVRLARDRDLGVVMVLVAGAACGVVSALIAAPIVALLGGVTGSGTDLLVAAFQQAGSDLETAVLQQSLLSDPIDKAITFVIAYTLLGAVSRRVTARYPQGERALGTIDA